MEPGTICELNGHRYNHVVRTLTASGTGETVDIVFLYCNICADVIEIAGDPEPEQNGSD